MQLSVSSKSKVKFKERNLLSVVASQEDEESDEGSVEGVRNVFSGSYEDEEGEGIPMLQNASRGSPVEMAIEVGRSAFGKAKNAASWALEKSGVKPKNLDADFKGRQGSRGSPIGNRTRSRKKQNGN